MYQLQERTLPDGAWRLVKTYDTYEQAATVARQINIRWNRFEAQVVGKDDYAGWIRRTEAVLSIHL